MTTNEIVPGEEVRTPGTELPGGAVVVGIGSGDTTSWLGWRYDEDGVTVDTLPHYVSRHDPRASYIDVTIRFRTRVVS
jgi:hypothetical protein